MKDPTSLGLSYKCERCPSSCLTEYANTALRLQATINMKSYGYGSMSTVYSTGIKIHSDEGPRLETSLSYDLF